MKFVNKHKIKSYYYYDPKGVLMEASYYSPTMSKFLISKEKFIQISKAANEVTALLNQLCNQIKK